MSIFDIDQEFEAAKKRAFRILERMPRTKKQLEEKLTADKKYSNRTIEKLIEYLLSYGYLNDRQYSKDYINARKTTKGLKLLIYELKNKGVDDVILEELKEEFSDVDSTSVIKDLISKKGINPATCELKEKQKLYRYLVSKGFSYSDIMNVISEYKYDDSL